MRNLKSTWLLQSALKLYCKLFSAVFGVVVIDVNLNDPLKSISLLSITLLDVVVVVITLYTFSSGKIILSRESEFVFFATLPTNISLSLNELLFWTVLEIPVAICLTDDVLLLFLLSNAV